MDTDMLPEMALTCIKDPEAEAPNVLERPTEELVAPDVKLTVTRAITPLLIVSEFMPVTKQICRPEPVLQDNDLPAAVSTDPTCQEAEEIETG